jgi:PAS domain S-box-containing protein
MARQDPSSLTSVPTILRYGIAVLSVAIAIGLDFFLLRHFEAILTPFLLAVAAAVWYAGTGPGMLAIVLSVLSLNYFFLRPSFSFSPIGYADLVYLAFCTFCALAVGWVSAVRRQAEQELRQAREELEAKVVERTANLQRSERYLAETQKLTHTGTWAWDARSRKALYCSEEMFRIFGLDPQEHLPTRKDFRQRVHPEDRNRVDERFARVVDERADSFDEYRVVLPDGITKHVNSSGHPVLDGNGELIEFVGTATDVTERKRAEGALRESEYKLRQIIETVPGLIWSADPAGEPTQVNQRLLDYSGMRLEDFQHGGWEAFLHPADFPETAKAFYQAIQTGTSYEAVHRLRRSADGEYRWHHARGEPLRDREGRIVQWYGLSVDIDEAKKAEDRLRRSEARTAEAQRLSHTGSAVYNETEILDWSEESSRIWGFDPLQGILSREAVWQRIHPDDLDRVNANIEDGLREKRGFANAFRIILPDGTVKHIEAINYPVFSAGGKLLEIVSTGIDVTERKQTEKALRESEARFRDYAETASDWFWEIGPDYKFTLLTENAFGAPAALRLGTACWDHALDLETEPEKWRLVRAILDSRKPFRDFVYRGLSGNGSPMYVRASGKPVFDANGEFRGYCGTGTDVTALRTVEAEARENERRYREAQLELAHANRVATIGQLTSSIAHEVNQPITAAVTYALAARRFLSAEPPNFREVDDVLSLIVKEGSRAGEVVGRIRALIQKAPARKDAVEINDAILEAIVLTRSEAANNNVSVRTQLAEGLPRVQGDRVQLQQVLLNLIINAIEAMRDVGEEEREMLISTRNEPDGVSVEVRDSGPGFAPAALERVFEAFYTTKPGGLGLGLSICRSIIEAHNGRLWASPNVPRGAIFGFLALAHSVVASNIVGDGVEFAEVDNSAHFPPSG